MDKHSVVGKRVPRIDAFEMVTGRAIYAADMALPGMLFGKVLRSKYPHAKIKAIDTTKAEKFPGVRAVVTGRDLPDSDVFAHDEITFFGQKIAAVAADSPDIAEEALSLIEFEYEELPAVVDPLEAMKPDAPPVRKDAKTREIFDENGVRLSNVSSYHEEKEGDIEKGLAEADVIVEATFSNPVVHQVYLEPHAAVARVEPNGRLTVWCSPQGIYTVRDELASILKMPLNQINVIANKIGGGFGGKIYLYAETIAALLALKTGKPVKVVDNRYEVFVDSHPAPASITKIKMGAKNDGTLVALDAETIWDGGIAGGGGSSERLKGEYKIPNVRLKNYGVYTNKSYPGAYRAPSAPQMTFVRESMIDMVARKLNIDPLEMRLKNAAKDGDATAKTFTSAYKETLLAAADKAKWRKGLKEGEGQGMAYGEWVNWVGSSAAYVILNEDGSIKVVSGSVDLTGTHTVFAQIAAEEFGLPLDKVGVSMSDSASMPYQDPSGGSRTAYGPGTTVKRAAIDAKQKILEFASKMLDVPSEKLEIADGRVNVKDSTDQSISFAELGQASIRMEEGPIVGVSTLANLPSPSAFSVQVAKVKVDPDTGQVHLLEFVAAQDVGFALNPISVEGQIQGGVTQGTGFALTETYCYDGEGHLLNPNLTDYRILTALDLPDIETTLVELRDSDGPYGAKGVGEPPIIPTAAAIANAIEDAIGVRITRLPITPEKIVKALKGA